MLISESYCDRCETCKPICRYKEMKHHVCDRCGESGPLYAWNGEELCRMCVWEDLELEEIKD